MTNEKSILYKKAYVELNEIFKNLDKNQLDRIPDCFLKNISKNMDCDYKFEFDKSKGIFEQKLMVETEALLIEIYERYLAHIDEKEIWDNYDRFCLKRIENEKRNKYGLNVFNSKSNSNYAIKNDKLIIKKKDNFFRRIINYLKMKFK